MILLGGLFDCNRWAFKALRGIILLSYPLIWPLSHSFNLQVFSLDDHLSRCFINGSN